MVFPAFSDEDLKQIHEITSRQVHILNSVSQRLTCCQKDQISHQDRVLRGLLLLSPQECDFKSFHELPLVFVFLEDNVKCFLDQSGVLQDDGSVDFAELNQYRHIVVWYMDERAWTGLQSDQGLLQVVTDLLVRQLAFHFLLITETLVQVLYSCEFGQLQ